MLEAIRAYVTQNPRRAALIGGVGLLCIFVLWGLLSRPSSAKNEHPDGYLMVCQNPACRHEFRMSLSEAEYRTKHPADPIHCPKCGQTNVLQAGSRPRPTGPAQP